jgi:hypothetical protein
MIELSAGSGAADPWSTIISAFAAFVERPDAETIVVR